jgi:hypothetical protein
MARRNFRSIASSSYIHDHGPASSPGSGETMCDDAAAIRVARR